MIKIILTVTFLFVSILVNAQQILLLDRMNGNKIVNDSTITISSTDPLAIELTAYFTMKNNTDHILSLNLRKTVHFMADSTIDYYCFGVQCWPGTDTTNIPDTIQPGAEDYTFASHVVHFRRFDFPPLAFGKSSITYTIFDDTSFPEAIEASVTVIYDHQLESTLNENNKQDALVYPNPASSNITVSGFVNFTGDVLVFIYDETGRVVRNTSVMMQDGKINLAVDALKPGCYFGRIITHTQAPLVFRFVI